MLYKAILLTGKFEIRSSNFGLRISYFKIASMSLERYEMRAGD
jgi:hypothetical protein